LPTFATSRAPPHIVLFLLKIAVPPVLVAAASLAARRWGPAVGGLLLGVPWMTGPVLFFLALEKGDDFAVAACTGIELGVACLTPFMLAYAAVSTFARWPLTLAVAATAFAASGWAIQDVAFPLPAAAAAAAASLGIGYLLLPRPRAPIGSAPLPWWDIPMRMLTALVLVALILITADALGPRLSGIVSTYPAMMTMVLSFTHSQRGRDAVRQMLHGVNLSLIMFVAFFLIVGVSLPALGLVASFVLATVVVLAVDGILLLAIRRRQSG
jgi:hypothetical protein